jgi:hypothetical protein
VPISSAQILDLANTPVTLIPGVAGKVTIPICSVVAYVAGATPYTDHGSTIFVASGPGLAQAWAATLGAGFWDQATSQVFSGAGGALSAAPASGYAAADVVLTADTANPTGGAVDSTLLVTLSYFLAPVT